MASGSSLFRRVGVLVCGAVLSAVLGTGGVAQGQGAVVGLRTWLDSSTGYQQPAQPSEGENTFRSIVSHTQTYLPGSSSSRRITATNFLSQELTVPLPSGPVVLPVGTRTGSISTLFTSTSADATLSGSWLIDASLGGLGRFPNNYAYVNLNYYWTVRVDQPIDFSLRIGNTRTGTANYPTGFGPTVSYNIAAFSTPERPVNSSVLSGNLYGPGDFTIGGSLQPDTYTIYMSVYGYFFATDAPTATSTLTTNYSFTLIPSPSATATLALGLLTLARRRR
jgi:hypothetical protein